MEIFKTDASNPKIKGYFELLPLRADAARSAHERARMRPAAMHQALTINP
jgi:hypothetical protein